MASSSMRALLPILLVAGASSEAGAQPGRGGTHPYTAALWAVANYHSCGVRARAGQVAALDAAMRTSEAEARAKGFGAALDRLEQGYQAQMAVSDITACAPGPARALTDARRAVAAFRRWAVSLGQMRTSR